MNKKFNVLDMNSKGIHNRLKLIRKTLGFSQVEFCRHLDVSKPAYVRYENGTREPKIKVLNTLRDKYNVDINWLISGRGEMFLDEEKKKMLGEVYEGEEKETVEELLYYLENAPVIRFAVLEYFMNYLYQNKDMIDAQIEESRNPRRSKK
jgi:transcriptional regulator with XRE-family HTH domain